ncbi:DUF5714 domain-containing protein [Thermophilibacter mediterraneus]|uniref:DUF5714 domain-containing protein n=1 Tax=Thermophilibacter mediterraneus TaxID=1871031 RepID=UPI0009300063|nr:DUF5714 domain-containing protein [Thermophilibacter mediterraneus]
MSDQQEAYAWATRTCEKSDALSPADLLEELMAAPECDAFGPVHHYLVGAALVTCVRNARGEGDLPAQLAELRARSGAVPGAACARWGVCGAAASCGMALAILLENAPLKPEGWSECQLMVSDLLRAIAEAGAPRCCKRDARIAVRGAVPWFERLLGVELAPAASEPRCAVSGRNGACLAGVCPYFAGA